jgi:lipopolysaccharide transport system ATP-binding protein
MIGSAAAAPFRRLKRLSGKVDAEERIWALKNVSFEVKAGEVVGLIGRNGAGKSTLLKILSRITAPTRGRVEVRGRMASLLEVGTGFHPELTGRENIYLNGAILGMSRAEITRKFDEIVAFAEIDRFLDTPVKRYSSGMHVRLAFAVGAHLETDILVVDEVLAVGDSEFQRRCLGKMRNVASQEGRTVLFVSHNLQAVQRLCDRTILLDAGKIVCEGDTRSVVADYLTQSGSADGEKMWGLDSAPGNVDAKLMAVRIVAPDGETRGTFSSDDDVYIEIDFVVQRKSAALCVGFDLTDYLGFTVFRTYQTDLPSQQWPPIKKGANHWRCKIPKGLLNSGRFFINPRIKLHKRPWIVHEDAVLQFLIRRGRECSPLWDNRPGAIAPNLQWSARSVLLAIVFFFLNC